MDALASSVHPKENIFFSVCLQEKKQQKKRFPFTSKAIYFHDLIKYLLMPSAGVIVYVLGQNAHKMEICFWKCHAALESRGLSGFWSEGVLCERVDGIFIVAHKPNLPLSACLLLLRPNAAF